MWENLANKGIKPPDNVHEVMYKNGDTNDIIDTIKYADGLIKNDTKNFSKSLKDSTKIQTLFNVCTLGEESSFSNS